MPRFAVDRALSGADVRRVLAGVVGRRGAPTRLHRDNGSEFIGEALRCWLPAQGTKPIPVAADSPWKNACIESLNSRFCDEFLEVEKFASVAEARRKAWWFRREYNKVRPHSSLAYKTPEEFARECDRGLHGNAPEKISLQPIE